MNADSQTLLIPGKVYPAIGLMSGTSLDGIDIAYCEFTYDGKGWQYSAGPSHTYPYSGEWKDLLSRAPGFGGRDLFILHHRYGVLLGETVKDFINRHELNPWIVASHGHTIHHIPEAGCSLQIGSGAALSVAAGKTVVCDFRSSDLADGGQGAPLVPIGDELLFGEYSSCLNIGGIANISYHSKGSRIAWDICPANMVLNQLSALAGKQYDKDGAMAASGTPDLSLIAKLDNLEYYRQSHPKSLGREWVEREFMPLLQAEGTGVEDLLSTCTWHIAGRIAASIPPLAQVLVTGGGAFNRFLMECVSKSTAARICIPDDRLVNFKEAIVFAFMGILRMLGISNCLSSVTGAGSNRCGGAVYLI